MGEPVIHSVANAMQVLDMVMGEGSVSVSDAARRLGIDRSNAYRLLKTLERGEYLSCEGKRYDLGYKLELFSVAGVNPLQMRLIAEPIMREVANETGEIVHLCMRVRTGMIFVHQEFSHRAIQVVKKHGAVEPVFCTASGRAALAFLPRQYQRSLLERSELKRYTKNTVTEMDALLEILRRTREQGYGEEIEEFNPGVRCIGVPVLNSRGWPQYSLGISYTSQGYSEQTKNRWIGGLRAGARQIAQACEDSANLTTF